MTASLFIVSVMSRAVNWDSNFQTYIGPESEQDIGLRQCITIAVGVTISGISLHSKKTNVSLYFLLHSAFTWCLLYCYWNVFGNGMEIHMLDWSRRIEVFIQKGYGRYHLWNKTECWIYVYFTHRFNTQTKYLLHSMCKMPLVQQVANSHWCNVS